MDTENHIFDEMESDKNDAMLTVAVILIGVLVLFGIIVYLISLSYE